MWNSYWAKGNGKPKTGKTWPPARVWRRQCFCGGMMFLLLNPTIDLIAIPCYQYFTCMTSTNQRCARGIFSRDRGETETLKPETEALTIQAEARPRPKPSDLETETRPRRTNSEARPSRGTTAPRDGLETEASRPRPHPGHQQNERKMPARRSS